MLRIHWYHAGPDRVERKQVDEICRPVLEEQGYAMPKPVSGLLVAASEVCDALHDRRIGPLETVRRVGRTFGNTDESIIGRGSCARLQRFKNGLGHQHVSPWRFYCLLIGSRSASSCNATWIGRLPSA